VTLDVALKPSVGLETTCLTGYKESSRTKNPNNNFSLAQRWANHNFYVGSQRWAIVILLVGATLGLSWFANNKPTLGHTFRQRYGPTLDQRGFQAVYQRLPYSSPTYFQPLDLRWGFIVAAYLRKPGLLCWRSQSLQN